MSEKAPASGLILIDDIGDGVSLVRLNRPERLNAWDAEMALSLSSGLARLEDDVNVRVLLLTGAGRKAFSSGAYVRDPEVHRVASVGQRLATSSTAGHAAFEALLRFSKPVICAVNGYAIGAGFLLALCCDIVLASDTAVFSLPQVQLGIMPAYAGVVTLARWVGRGRAMNIALTGRRVPAAEAEDIGIVSSIHSSDKLEGAATELARVIASHPPLAVRMTKESLNLGLEGGVSSRSAGVADFYRLTLLQLTDDAAEAHAAFREKRRGRYNAR